MQIAGRTALITGAASGIGRAIAQAFAAREASAVWLCDLDERGLEGTARLVEEGGSRAIQRRLDVTDHVDLALALEEASAGGRLSFVCNNAGIVSGPPDFPDNDDARIALMVAVNLTAVIVGTRLAAKCLAAQGGGAIVNTASVSAYRPALADAPYRASKAGVVMLTECCRDLREKLGVRVNAVVPGIVETPLLDQVGGGDERPEWLQEITRTRHVLRPEEVAKAVMMLCEDDSRAGENLLVGDKAV